MNGIKDFQDALRAGGFISSGPDLRDMKKQHSYALSKAESIVEAAETAGRKMSDAEEMDFDTAMAAANSLSSQIKKREAQTNSRQQIVQGRIIPAGGNLRLARVPNAPVVLSEEYANDFFTWVGSRGQQIGAALYEGAGSAGGFAVPVIVDGQIVPLAPQELGIRSLATIVPTASDIKVPRGIAFGEADAKAEGDGTGTNLFTESDPSLDQFTLAAFMAGAVRTISWELAQDVPSFQQFCITDLVTALQVFEEGKYAVGSGTNEAQGLIGNTGAGVTGVAAGTDSYASELLDASFDVLGKLNAAYHPGARWLMSRSTGVLIRKAQTAGNLFQPVWTREGGKDYLHGYEVAFSGSMPAVATTKTPVLFGDFKAGYIIGDRGGAGINLKILDQPKATEGLLQLLAYRRTDGRVRRSEAIQAITLA